MHFDEWLEDILTYGSGLPTEAPERATVTVRYLGKLFAECGTLLSDYPDSIVGAGLYSAIDGGGAACACYLRDRTVPFELRRQTTLSIYHVFADCFAVRPGLHQPPEDQPCWEEPWRYTCYMWWDIYCGWDPSMKPNRLGATQLEVMEAVLALDCRECRMSALHGLGHSVGRGARAEVHRIIDAFLSRVGETDEELVEYARQARTGQILEPPGAAVAKRAGARRTTQTHPPASAG